MKNRDYHYRIMAVLFLIFQLVFVGCQKDMVEVNEANHITIIENTATVFNAVMNANNKTFKFETKVKNDRISSQLTIAFNESDNRVKLILNNITDLNLTSRKLLVHESVINQAQILKNQIDKSNSVDIKREFEIFAKLLIAHPQVNFEADMIQEIFLFNGIISTVNRSFSSSKACDCTPHPGYLAGQVPFWCQEDYFTKIDDIILYYKKYPSKAYGLSGSDELLNYVLNRKDRGAYQVSYKELFELRFSVEEYKAALHKSKNTMVLRAREDCWLGLLGSDLGCCGNYDGCCWIATLDCFRHDIECYKCDRWHCGPSCVAEN